MSASTTPRTIDIRDVRMINLDEKAKKVSAKTKSHHAIELPDFGLVFPNFRGIKVTHWNQTVAAGASHTLFDKACVAPDPSELGLIVDRNELNPALNRKHFPLIDPDEIYWTSKPLKLLASSPGACCVLFHDGYVLWDWQHLSGLVLPVLRVPTGQ